MKVVIAVDGSEHAEFAVKWYLAKHRPENEIVLVHCIELHLNTSLSYHAGMALPRHEWEMMMQRSEELYRAVQQKVSPLFIEKGIKHKFVRIEGHPGESICEVAKGEKAEMIVIGTRGLGKVRRTFLGSVSDYVLHHAHVPVAICRQ